MDIQLIIVGLIVAAATVFLFRNLMKRAKQPECGSGQCGCAPNTERKHT
jgi:FeoB-associated Cys-rich membrane protein